MTVAHRLSGLVFVVIALFGLACQSPAHAQAEINLPPLADTQSPTGVSFKTGGFNIGGILDLSIGGEGLAGLRLIRKYSSTDAVSWSYNTTASIIRNPYIYPPDQEPPPPHLHPLTYTVLTGSSSSRFRGGYTTSWAHKVGVYTPFIENGESLVFTKIGDGGITSGSYFTFTDARGTVYTYTANAAISLTKITFPDGTTHDYISGGKIISSRGYMLLRESATKSCVINMAEHYVTAATTTCPSGVQTVNYTIGSGPFETGGGSIASATNALGQTTTYTYVGWGHLNCIKDPGQSACRITNIYNVCPPPDSWTPANRQLDQVVSQTTATGETYTYNFPDWDICNEYTGYGFSTSMIAPGGATTVVGTNGAGAVTDMTDPLGRSSWFGYDDGSIQPYEATRLYATWAMEGNDTWFVRDPRANVIEKRMEAKPGSGLANIVSTASYPATCTNRKTCNRPDYIIDARGYRTDYTWDPNHGGMLTETRPAGANGVRPQKRLTYTQLYAYIKNSSGGYVPAATPVWMLTGTSECMTQTSCAGTADEIKTTITYGATGTANNLLPTVVTVAAGDNSISSTTTTTYDFAGNAITIDGPLADNADTCAEPAFCAMCGCSNHLAPSAHLAMQVSQICERLLDS